MFSAVFVMISVFLLLRSCQTLISLPLLHFEPAPALWSCLELGLHQVLRPLILGCTAKRLELGLVLRLV